jgi:hypothetical protein
MPAPTKPAQRYLELRINSVMDAKAVVQHQGKIFADYQRGKFDGIEYIVAKEVLPYVGQYIDKLFRAPTIREVVDTKNGNVLGEIPHLVVTRPKLNPIPPVPTARSIPPVAIEQPRVKRKYTRRTVKVA